MPRKLKAAKKKTVGMTWRCDTDVARLLHQAADDALVAPSTYVRQVMTRHLMKAAPAAGEKT